MTIKRFCMIHLHAMVFYLLMRVIITVVATLWGLDPKIVHDIERTSFGFLMGLTVCKTWDK